MTIVILHEKLLIFDRNYFDQIFDKFFIEYFEKISVIGLVKPNDCLTTIVFNIKNH